MSRFIHPGRAAPLAVDVSKIDLTHVQDEWMRSLNGLLAHWGPIATNWRDQIVNQVRAAVNRDDIKALTRMAVSTADAEQLLVAAFDDMAAVAAQQMADDAARQGVNIDPNPGPSKDRRMLATLIAYLAATALTGSAAREAARWMNTDARGDQVAQAVRDHLNGLSDAYPKDLLGGGLTSAQNDGRFATVAGGPEVALYASEQMDRGTCRPCREVNGKWLGNSSNMAQVYEVYPNGGYVSCLGGSRCRGTIVAVYRPDTAGPDV